MRRRVAHTKCRGPTQQLRRERKELLAGWQEMRGSAPANTNFPTTYLLLISSSYYRAKRTEKKAKTKGKIFIGRDLCRIWDT